MLKRKSKKKMKKAFLGGILSFVGCTCAAIVLPYFVSGDQYMIGGKIGICFIGAALIFIIIYVDLTNISEL
jgi:hypothetical protein